MNREEVLHIINDNSLSPNIKLGQNFLVSEEITQKIICTLSLKDDLTVLEIGPGLGALSREMAAGVNKLQLVEIDSGIVKYLERVITDRNVIIRHGDFLKLDHTEDYDIIVSNLPYYCASEILFTIAANYAAQNVFVMVQREMAERITSKPGTKEYGALAVNLNIYFSPKILFHVPRSAFFPRPDVASTFMQLSRRTEPLLNRKGMKIFHDIVKSAFWGRRKKIVTALTQSPFITFTRSEVEGFIIKAGVCPEVRGESLSLEDYVAIVKAVCELHSM